MITVEQADAIVLSHAKDFGTEAVELEQSLGRVLAEDIFTDRDLPPCNRVTMDGIAIRYESLSEQNNILRKIGTQAAGDIPIEITGSNQCVEIMTGAALPDSTDTIIRYEDLLIDGDQITIKPGEYKKGQNVHPKGIDKKQGDLVLKAGMAISSAEIAMLASVGKAEVLVKRLPKIVAISTGDELLPIESTPLPWQVRSSNGYMLKALLKEKGIAADILHLPDNVEAMEKALSTCLQTYDVILLSGSVSMGKFDLLPTVLDGLHVKKLFHRVQQRPGKPFWFGIHEKGATVFAFPGNPVSTFMCAHRYLLPWLHLSLYGTPQPKLYAMLSEDFDFNLQLQYFLQVKLNVNQNGQLQGAPIAGNGSGDFANLNDTNAFMELPLEINNFKKGSVFPIWPYKPIV